MVGSHNIQLDEEYALWMADLKNRYRKAQVRAAIKVNAEQLLFNWQLGRDLVLKRVSSRWLVRLESGPCVPRLRIRWGAWLLSPCEQQGG